MITEPGIAAEMWLFLVKLWSELSGLERKVTAEIAEHRREK
jgi:hypothetical protein